LGDVGDALREADGDALHAAAWRIDDLAVDVRSHGSFGREWPAYGALLTNLRNIADALDRVAAAHPIVAPRDHRWLSPRPGR
jgi:hypothetical protein